MKKLLLTVLMSGITGMASADIVPGKIYRIASAANEERVMFVDNSSLANNTSVVVWTDTEVPAQQWEAIANGDGTFSFMSTQENISQGTRHLYPHRPKCFRQPKQATWDNGAWTP